MSQAPSFDVDRRAALLLLSERERSWRHTDRTFVSLMIVQWLAAVGAALLISPARGSAARGSSTSTSGRRSFLAR